MPRASRLRGAGRRGERRDRARPRAGGRVAHRGRAGLAVLRLRRRRPRRDHRVAPAARDREGRAHRRADVPGAVHAGVPRDAGRPEPPRPHGRWLRRARADRPGVALRPRRDPGRAGPRRAARRRREAARARLVPCGGARPLSPCGRGGRARDLRRSGRPRDARSARPLAPDAGRQPAPPRARRAPVHGRRRRSSPRARDPARARRYARSGAGRARISRRARVRRGALGLSGRRRRYAGALPRALPSHGDARAEVHAGSRGARGRRRRDARGLGDAAECLPGLPLDLGRFPPSRGAQPRCSRRGRRAGRDPRLRGARGGRRDGPQPCDRLRTERRAARRRSRIITAAGDEITSYGKKQWGHFNVFPLAPAPRTEAPEEAAPPYFDLLPEKSSRRRAPARRARSATACCR